MFEYEAACSCGHSWRFRDDRAPDEMELETADCVWCGQPTNEIVLIGTYFVP